MANADGYIFWYNRRWHEYCGTTPAQMEGWGWQSVHEPAVLPDVLALGPPTPTGAPSKWTDARPPPSSAQRGVVLAGTRVEMIAHRALFAGTTITEQFAPLHCSIAAL
jgi:hypothetical protein